MKRSFISLVVAALIVGNISGVQAATNDTSNVSGNNSSNSTSNENAINISLTNIKDIIIQNNQQAKIYENTRENTKLDYDNANTAKNTAESNYNTAVSNYNTAESDYNTALAKYNQDPANNTKPTAPTAVDKTALDTAELTLNKAKYSLRTADNTYNQNMQSLVETAQNDYISYVLNDLPSKDYNTADVQALKNAADAAKVQYDMGFISENDYTTAQLNYTNALNSSNSSNDTEENDKAKLLNDLGLSSGENVIFDTNLEQDLKDVSTINYNNDLTQMFNNNLTLQNDNIAIEQASDNKDNYDGNSTDENDDNYDNTLEQYDNTLNSAQAKLVLDKNNAETNFKTKYDALMNSYATMKNSYNSLQQQNNSYDAEQVQYDYGFASKQAVDESKVNSLKTSESYQKDESTFYANYLNYIDMKEGD
ncbi:hypothetical protein [Clostridium sp.]|uniref:hypothetical protein n=1 Tax=Clostridium sp. TaxID=1506 RepID=UPI00283D5396|nr:hypothetical protein [Clostridium sp.]MDR3595588.1 hypothetical protein [Clostridium sp.]